VVGSAGRNVLANKLGVLKERYRADIAIVNGENAAGGRAINPEAVNEIFRAGADLITTGNHVWDNNDILKIIDTEPLLIRPANYPSGVRGKGYHVLNYRGTKICVINLIGRVNMYPVDCPFRKFDEIYDANKNEAEVFIVDFHAEATSEKRAFGWYAAERATVVYGTHTHVQTADEEILNGKTAYITDIGMTGAFDSVIGMNKNYSIEKFLKQVKVKLDTATENQKINGALFVIGSGGVPQEIIRISE
jgi:metallophosphoesterase (TIGR00282 family)